MDPDDSWYYYLHQKLAGRGKWLPGILLIVNRKIEAR